MARFLITASIQGWIEFPIEVEHRDNTGKPDFLLTQPNGTLGIECVEAVPKEWYEIEAIRERKFPNSFNFVNRFNLVGKTYTSKEKESIASGDYAGPPWEGDEPEREWAEAHEHFIAEKVRKVRNGNYEPTKRLWLLVQDEWRVPVSGVGNRLHAADLLLPRVRKQFTPPSFEEIFVSSSPLLFRFSATEFEVKPLEDPWNDG